MPWNEATPSRVTGCKGQYKTWTLDYELDHGLDCGLDHGLDCGLDHGLDCGLDRGLDHGLDTDNGLFIWTRSWMASGQWLCANYPRQSFDVL